MSITVYPYKLTERVLEARLAPGLTVLPGQLLRFESEMPVYGKIVEVRALPSAAAGMPESIGVVIELLHGVPSLEPQTLVLLTAAQMAQDVQKLLEPLTHPLRLSNRFSVDFERLGTFTLIESQDFLLKYEALHRLVDGIKAYRRVLVIDPLGIFEEGGGYTYRKAGRDVRLSVQHIGTRQFLEAFGNTFSLELREVALRAVADHLPMTKGFIGFSHWLNLEAAVNVPLKNLIVQNYHAVLHSQVFADTPDQVFDLNAMMDTEDSPVCVLDISELPEPWKGLFYQEACRVAFGPESDVVIPVLLYPENYLPDLLLWVQMADEAGLSLLMLASAFSGATLRGKASNYIWVESAEQMEVQGSLTLGLPIRLPLSTHQIVQERIRASAKTTVQEAAVEPVTETEYEPYVSTPVANGLLNPPEFEPASSPPPVFQNTPAADEFVADWGAVAPQEEIEDITSEEPEPLAESAGPIVDLSAPPPEPSISFLSAEQLSQLLASNSGAQMPLESEMPLTEEAEKPKVRRVPPVSTPVVFEEVASDDVTETKEDKEHYGYSSFQVDLDDVQEAQAMEPRPASASSPVQQMPLHSPFPAPEEYEKEEFSFDLEPDISTEPQSMVDTHAGAANVTGIQETVSRSLDEFSQDLPLEDDFLDEPFFEIEPGSGQSSAPSMPEVAVTSSVETRTSSALLEEDEMQEALDLMFPLQENAQPDESLPEQLSVPSEQSVMQPPSVSEVEVPPIIQKQALRSSGNQDSFQVGEQIRHATYGMGVIQKIIPMDETVILNIMFEKVGKRLLDPALCELVRMDM